MITIDKEFQSLIPPLSEDEYKQLEANCVADGIRDPLVVWKQEDGTMVLLDGHNRMKISAEHGGIPFQIVEKHFRNRDEALVWIFRNQIGRRNLSAYDRSVLALKLKPKVAELAKKSQSSGIERSIPQISGEQAIEETSEKKVEEIKKQGYSADTTSNLIDAERHSTGRQINALSLAHHKHIYFIRMNDVLKVGSSYNVQSRLKQFKTNAPSAEIVGDVFYGDGAETFEGKIRKRFSEYALSNETYRYSEELLSQMISFTKRAAERKNETDYQVAQLAGVSHDTIHKVEAIERSPNETIKQQVRSGDISINQAYNTVMTEKAEREGRIPHTQAQKKRQELAEAHERHEAYDPSGVASIADARQDRQDRKTIALEWCRKLKNALQDLYWTGALNKTELFAEIRKALTDDERERLIKRIVDARMVLNAALSELED